MEEVRGIAGMGGNGGEVLNEVLDWVRAVRSRQERDEKTWDGGLCSYLVRNCLVCPIKIFSWSWFAFVARRSSCHLILLSRNRAQRDFSSAKILRGEMCTQEEVLVREVCALHRLRYPQILVRGDSGHKGFYWQEILIIRDHYKFCSQEVLLPNR